MSTVHPERTPVGVAILERLRRAPGTVREVAQAIGYKVRHVAPLATMLAEVGEIRPTGERRANVSGRTARVWEVTPPE